MKKYELTTETLQFAGRTLHRIKAVKDFDSIKAGEFGGWIENEKNLSQDDNAWIYGNATVFDNAKILGNAKVYGKAEVYGNAKVYGKAEVYGNAYIYNYAKVYGNAAIKGDTRVYGNAEVYGNAVVYGNATIKGDAKVHDAVDYIVFKNFWSSGRYFTWTRSDNKWRVGCFYGTGEELIKKAYADSEKSGREYERVVRYVESILADEKKEKSD